MTAKKIILEINRLKSELYEIEKKIKDKNTPILVNELLNLRDHVGDGYIEEDYYAPERYYSQIEGVKNLRIASYDEETKTYKLMVKCTSPRGYLLPSEIEVDGDKFKLVFFDSSQATKMIDY